MPTGDHLSRLLVRYFFSVSPFTSFPILYFQAFGNESCKNVPANFVLPVCPHVKLKNSWTILINFDIRESFTKIRPHDPISFKVGQPRQALFMPNYILVCSRMPTLHCIPEYHSNRPDSSDITRVIPEDQRLSSIERSITVTPCVHFLTCYLLSHTISDTGLHPFCFIQSRPVSRPQASRKHFLVETQVAETQTSLYISKTPKLSKLSKRYSTDLHLKVRVSSLWRGCRSISEGFSCFF